MFHPLLGVLASRPQLLVQHAGAYGRLIGLQVRAAGEAAKGRLLWLALMGGGILLALGLSGMALLLWAALPVDTMPRPWLLIGLPVVPALVALGSAWALRRPQALWSAELLKEQWDADAALLREAGDA